MANLEIIPVRNHLLKNLKIDDVKRQVIDRVQKFPNYQQYKADIEFLLLVANMLEHLIVKADKINKKEVLVEIYKQTFTGLKAEEITAIEQNIEFLWNNKKIKKVSYYKLFKTAITEWIKKKFL
jgi:PBP1b-binding outer membrane lipoprotein LpoB